MATDLDIIRQLEKQLGRKLHQLKKIDPDRGEGGYVIDERLNIYGLSWIPAKEMRGQG